MEVVEEPKKRDEDVGLISRLQARVRQLEWEKSMMRREMGKKKRESVEEENLSEKQVYNSMKVGVCGFVVVFECGIFYFFDVVLWYMCIVLRFLNSKSNSNSYKSWRLRTRA